MSGNVKRRILFNDGVWIHTRGGVAFKMAPLFTEAFGFTLDPSNERIHAVLKDRLDTPVDTTVVLPS